MHCALCGRVGVVLCASRAEEDELAEDLGVDPAEARYLRRLDAGLFSLQVSEAVPA